MVSAGFAGAFRFPCGSSGRFMKSFCRRVGAATSSQASSGRARIGSGGRGTAAFVPPPPELVLDCMSALERFLHDERADLPLLVKAGLVHVQFETIHPFLDGNGRLGRLLITFLLCAAGVLREPILYLSLYFKQHRPSYYELLDRVRTKGEWETWLDFFLTGVRDTAEHAATAARRIHTVFEDHHRK